MDWPFSRQLLETLRRPSWMFRIPHRVYKYRTVSDRSIDSLAACQLWAAKPSSFNDPFDCALVIDPKDIKELRYRAAAKAIASIDKNHLAKLTPKHRSQLEMLRPEHFMVFADPTEEIRSQIRNNLDCIGVISLSEVPDSALMWSHYADSHRGFCVEYEFGPDSDLRALSQRVVYSDNAPVASILNHMDDNALRKLTLTKSKSWSYEREWRAIMEHSDVRYSISQKDVLSVIFGAKSSTADKARVRAALTGISHINFKQALLAEGRLSLRIVDA